MIPSNLESSIVELYHKLPHWAKRDLFYCNNAWEFSGNDILGWSYKFVSDLENKTKDELFFDTAVSTLVSDTSDSMWTEGLNDRIPCDIKFYGRKIKDMFYKVESDMEIDVELIDGDIILVATIENNDEKYVIIGDGPDSLIASFNLYFKCVSLYEEVFTPSITFFHGVQDSFVDNYNHDSISFKEEKFIRQIYDKYYRFIEDLEAIPVGTNEVFSLNSNEKYFFKIRTIEGLVKVYIDYGELSDYAYLNTQHMPGAQPFISNVFTMPSISNTTNTISSINVGTGVLINTKAGKVKYKSRK